MTALARAFGAGLILICAWVVFALGGLAAAAYVVLLALAVVPGLPLGFALFGRRHAAGWVAGTLIGYALTAWTSWAVVFAGAASPLTFALGWAALCGVTWGGIGRLRGRAAPPFVELPPWGHADTAALCLVLLLVPALVGPPFLKIGAIDTSGNRLYRAYFTADFVWHTALVAEMTKHSQPPRNPYLASEPVHYYWTYFLVPATISSLLPSPDVELALELNALCAALLFVSAIYLAAWAVVPVHPFVVALAVALTAVAASAEGLAATVDLVRRRQPLSVLRELNIDAISSWAFKGLRIDNLPRAMWYTPQHAMACALGLTAVPVAIWAGARARAAAIALAGLALAASVTFNPLLGAAFSAIYGSGVVIDAFRQRSLRGVARHGIAAALVLIAVGWCVLNQMTEGAGSALHVGFVDPARNAPVVTFLLSFGPILLPLLIGLWPRGAPAPGRAATAVAGLTLSLFLMYFVTLTVDIFWVGFRAGNIFLVFVPALVARGFVAVGGPRWTPIASGLALVTLAAGLPTTMIDAYNTQDVTNRLMSVGGFHWTVALTPAEQEGLAWIRTHTPTDAIVQAEPIVRGRETWTLIPSFAERRMAAGLPISLMHVRAYDETSDQVRRIYAETDSDAAWRSAKALGIDYLYVDETERAAYPAVSKFSAHPEHFTPVFTNTEVRVYRVQ